MMERCEHRSAWSWWLCRGLYFGLSRAFAVLCLLAIPLAPAGAQLQPAPEAATGYTAKQATTARHYMVAAANPIAAQAGLEILRTGGSAIDAAIAMQMVLNLVEPQSSGLGGGAFLVHFTAEDRRVDTYDGRETAPAAAKPDRFLDADGKPVAFYDAVVGGRSVGVPGVLRALEMAHKAHGVLPWARLFEPAIRLAESGFTIGPRLHDLLAGDKYLRANPAARAYFYQADGTPKPVGAVLVNPALAEVLKAVAGGGADAFYSGDIARDIVATVTGAKSAGDMTMADLADYRAQRRDPVCGPYRLVEICGMGPPSSGGLTVLQIFGMLASYDIGRLKPASVAGVHLIAEAERLAYADRGLYMADTDFVPVPVAGLIDSAYLKARARLIEPGRAMGPALPGDPPGRRAEGLAPDNALELPSTSHLSVVDGKGNALSMTTTIENAFGSRLMVRGFLLNNELTDFSFLPEENGKPVANRIEAGKRPRSAMSPTLVFDPGRKLRLVVGSVGGSAIITHVAKTLVAYLDWGYDIQAAISLDNFGNRNGPTELEAGPLAAALEPGLTALGHRVAIVEFNSGVHGIAVVPDGLVGGADPRREGIAVGD